jgi:hypothetical protein
MSPELVAKQVAQEIDNLARVTASDGWDSYDASPIDRAAIELATEYVYTAAREIQKVFQPPIVGPTAAPGVTLVWRMAGKGELSAHFTEHEATFMILSPDRQTIQIKGVVSNPKSFAVDLLRPYLTQSK